MVFTIGTLLEASLLLINAIAILNEERFLKKIGWGRDFRNEGFGEQTGIKSQLISLITAVQTLLRGILSDDITFNQNYLVGDELAIYKCSFSDVTYSITTVSPADGTPYFDIDSDTGVITLLVPGLNISAGSLYTVDVACAGSGSDEQDENQYTFERKEENEYSPMFSHSTALSIVVSASFKGTVVLDVNATDQDLGIYGQITYQLQSVSQPNIFTLDSSTGELTQTAMTFKHFNYSLTIAAMTENDVNSNVPSSNVTEVTANVNYSPLFSSDNSFYQTDITEGKTPSSGFITVNCTDKNIADELTYSLTGNLSKFFNISSNGELQSFNAFDYEDISFYQFTVVCSDGIESAEATIQITVSPVNEYAPTITLTSNLKSHLFEDKVLEDDIVASMNPGAYFTIVADDEDKGEDGELTFSLSGLNTDVKDFFAINSTNGDVYFTEKLDIDSTGKVGVAIGFIIKACDLGGLCTTSGLKSFVVLNSADELPMFEQSSYHVKIEENKKLNTSLVSVKCSDADRFFGTIQTVEKYNDTFTNPFQITEVIHKVNTEIIFDVNLLLAFDYEESSSHVMYFRCSDSTGNVAYSNVTIDVIPVNDIAPDFTNATYSFSISRTVPGDEDYIVGTVTAIDGDLVVGNQVSYSVQAGTGHFDVNSKGDIILKKSVADYPVNYILFEVVASDSVNEDVATVYIDIETGNYLSPEFIGETQVEDISELTSIGTEVLTVFCNDTEFGENGRVSYEIYSGNSGNAFGIDPDTGEIFVNNLLILPQGEDLVSYVLTLKCSDNGIPSLFDLGSAIIQVYKADVLPPDIKNESIIAFIDEGTMNGHHLLTITAEDLDTDSLRYFFLNESHPNEFTITEATGEVYVNSEIDRETTSEYSMVVVAEELLTNTNPNPKNDSADLFIYVRDINDNSPDCGSVSTLVEISKTLKIDQTIYQLNCLDDDVGNNGNVTFDLEDGFDVIGIEANGRIFLENPLNSTNASTFYLKITVSDQGSEPNKFELTILVVVLSTNDNPPVFVNLPASINVNEDSGTFNAIYTVEAEDMDEGIHSVVRYKLLDQSELPFKLIPNTGELYLIESLDYHSKSSYTLNISSADTDFVVYSTLTINVIDVNEFTPECSSTLITRSVTEETKPSENDPIDLGCLDEDKGSNGDLVYEIVSGNTNDVFGISDGSAELLKALDYEIQESYDIEVNVSDSGTPPRFTTVTVRINVQPVNEFSPQLNDSYSESITEGADIGSTIFNVGAFDEDSGVHGDLKFSLDPQQTDFGITNDGDLIITGDIDRETIASYNFKVIVQDSGTSPKSSTATINITVADIDDNSPSFTEDLYTSVVHADDAMLNSVVTTVICTDSDDGENADVDYSIISSEDSAFFNISSKGEVAISELSLLVSGIYSFGVRCFGTVNPNLTDTAQVSITIAVDSNITFSEDMYIVNLFENTTIGSVIVTINASSITDSSLTYDLANTTFTMFQLNKESGDLTLAGELDYETTQSYVLEVKATDSGSPPNSGIVAVNVIVININDEPPSFVLSDSVVEVTEEEDDFLYLATYKCEDNDLGSFGEVTYSLSGDDEDYFKLGETSGQLFLNNPIDYEEVQSIELQVTCSDGGTPAETDSLSVSVSVIAVNEYTPEFSSDSESISLSESLTPPNTLTSLDLEATDQDHSPHNSIHYSIISGNDDNTFFLSSDDGTLTLIKQLDYETQSSYDLTIMADDSGGDSDLDYPVKNSTIDLSISITDENDNDPMLDKDVYVGSLSETAEIDDQVESVTLICTDDDSGDNGKTTISIEDDNSGIFEIDNSNGKVILKKQVDYESNTFFSLTVRCSDMGSPSRYDEASLTINIEDYSEYGPLFEEQSYEFSVNESAAFGSVVGQVKAVDADAGGNSEITYLADTDDIPFSINFYSGVITISSALDYEDPPTSFVLNVTARDDENNDEDVTIVVINILNVDDNKPYWFKNGIDKINMVDGSIAENSDPGDSVLFDFNFLCSDADDEADGIAPTFTIVSDNSVPFSIIDTEGEYIKIVSNDILDAEITNRYEFKIYCFDSGLTNVSLSMTIDILPYNDFAPEFLDTPYTTTVSEDTDVLTSIFQVSARDEDVIKYNDITYGIYSGNDNNDFSIDSSDGTVRVANSLDYEEVSSYTLKISASNIVQPDDTSPTLVSYADLKIEVTDVNDPPVLKSTFTYVIANTSEPVGYHIADVTCEDPDSGVSGNTTITLTNHLDHFQLLDNGTIIISGSSIPEQAILEILCEDMGSPSLNSTLSITVENENLNLNSPVFANTSVYFNIYENYTGEIGCVTATDADIPDTPSGTLTYSIELEEGENHFIVDPDTGCLNVSATLNYNDLTSYRYKITATDGGEPAKFSEAFIYINILNVEFDPPEFTQSVLIRMISENAAAGALVTNKLVCTDKDDTDVITYSILSGNEDGIFNIDTDTGEVVLAKPLDYEKQTQHTLVLECTDSTNLTDTATISIVVGSVNEHTPSIEEMLVYADEESPVGTVITIISYTDLDSGPDGEVDIEIIGGGFEESFFVIDDALYFNETLDREDNIPVYPIELRITDKAVSTPKRTSVNFVNVSLNDINDNEPIPDQSVYTTEQVNATINIGYLIETVNCVDADLGINAEVTYSIEENSLLAVDPESGEVTVSGNLKNRKTDTIALSLTCTDKGQPSLSSEFLIQVPVFDPNLFDPVFLEASYAVTLPENYNLSTVFLNVTATDDDIGLNGNIEYSLVDDFDNLFYIDSVTGEISLLTELDFETDDSYSLDVLAIDGTSDSPMRRNGSVTVNVTVTGINEFTPECKKPIYTAIISANDTGPILQLGCDDSDNGIDGEIDFEITPGSAHSGLITVNSTGWISIPSSIPPNASIEVYEISVTVFDKGSPSKEYQVEVDLIYSFKNEHSPVFSAESYSAATSESTSVGTIVTSVSATDDDPGLQGDVEYSVTGTNYFRVNPQSGDIYISEELDYEQEKSVSFHVIATDSDPNEPLSSNASVTITIEDINDNSPTCDEAFYSAEIGSSLAINQTVFNITGRCTDIDGIANSQLSYSLTPTDTFNVNADSGIIYVNGPLTAGTSTALTVTVKDSGSPSLSTDITVSVIVRFDNVEPPHFTNNTYEFNIDEDADLLTVIGQVSANDEDTDANDLTYTLTTAIYSDIFYIDPQSGEILLTDQLDHELVTSYEVVVQVEDSGNYDGTNKLSDNATVIITVNNVNDNVPVLNDNGLYGIVVNKTTPVNEVVVTITCTDADFPPYASTSITKHGFTSEIPFKLVESGDEWEIQVSSVLTTINGSVSYDVNFTCSDNGGEEVIGQVFLSVPDVDAPVFNQTSYEWQVSEDAESGETFTYIKATSEDLSDVEYEIIDGNSNSLFYINPNTGVVSLTGSLDYEEQTSYGLVIQATDGKLRSSTVLLRVFVLDVDDHIPLVPPSAYLTVNHNKPVGYPVGSVSCVDDDFNGGNISFSLIEASDEFAIDDDGIITLTSVLDETPVYVLPVSCYDKSDPDSVSKGIVTVQVVFLNLYEPEFDLSSYEVSVKESIPVDSVVVNVTATDDDIGNQGELSYSITSGSEDKFYINTQSGVISLLTLLDRESEDAYVLTVNAVDGGMANTTARKTGSTTVNVYVEDVNDNNPVFMEQSYVATILTNHTVLSEVVQVQCQDDDSGLNGEFDYSIQPPHDAFIIDTSGNITLAEAQSEEIVYNIYAYCTDKGDPSLSSSALVTIAVNQVELGDPVFEKSLYSVTIPEDQDLLDSFLTVKASVDNPGVDIAYSIISGNTANTFTINANTGELSLIENLDYNTLSTYTLTIKATTLTFSQKSSQVLVSITVEDVNDNDPVFSPLPFYSGRVKESDDINTPVVQVNCTDDDPTDVLSYTLSGNNPSNGGEYFRITDTGLVTIKQSLDYETTTVYTLSVECSDGTNEVEATVRVDIDPVNEFKPVFLSSLYSFTLDENTDIGAEVGYVNATDDDAGIDGEITYLVDDPENLSPIFIDPTSGKIVLSLLLDYEVQNFYNVSVIARDSGGSESYVPVELTVSNLNDEPPILTPSVTSYSGRVPTDSPEGLFIEYFECTDPDGGNTSISITSGNEKGYFKLNSFDQLIWNGTSDNLESDIVITIMLKCTDDANDEDTSSIAIVVGKPGVEPPEFTSSKFIDSIEENATIDTSVLTVKATPTVSNHTIEYSLFSFDVGVPFAINNISGVVTVDDSLDYESFDFYTFPVQAKDVQDGSISIATVEITILDINDNHPEILPSSIIVYVKEDASTDLSYAKFSCSDSDSDKNGDTVFMIEGSEADTFAISSSSGSVTLKESLDFESVVVHNVTVICVDNGAPQLTGTATLIVQVTGVNEHAPIFDKASYNFTVQEDDALNKFVGSVNASDEDDGNNGVFIYEVSGGNGQDYFRIDESNGEIYVNNYLNASVSDSLSLVIAATDNGPPSAMVTTVLVDVSVTDVNEKPYFDELSYTKLIATDTAMKGDTLGTVTCFDYDLGLNAELTMTISSNDLPEVLVLEGDLTGDGLLSRDLVLNSTIDAGVYEVILQCNDSGTPSMSMSVSFDVTVQGVNTAPEFSKSVYGLSVHEDTETDKSLLKVMATDAEGGSVTYALIGGAGLGTFELDETTGVLSLSQSLNYEVTEAYTLTVGAIDDDELNQMTGSATIAVTVKNINDNEPQLSPTFSTSTLDEGTYEAYHVFYKFTCSDNDESPTVLSVTPNPPFDISSDGVVSFTGVADYEEDIQYSVTVTCTDEVLVPGDEVMTKTASLIININPVNFFAPVLTSTNTFNVSEGSDVGDEIFVLTANDPDGRGTITFTSSSHDETFILNENGSMVLLKELDRESKDMYELTVEISDGDPKATPKKTVVQITINVLDVNDNSPTCTSGLDTILIQADTYNDSISLYNASCSDNDIGNNSLLVYSITDTPDEGSFNIDSETGELTFFGTITKLSTSTLITITVSDSGKESTSPATIQLILSVITGDEPYFDPTRFSVNISENQAAVDVFYSGQNFIDALNNVDEDDHVVFSLSTNSTIFIIASTGDIHLLSSGLLDYDEGLQEYSLGIQAKIGSVDSEYAEAILDIFILDYNDNPPQFFMSAYNGSIVENLDESDLESTVILTVSASDIDSNSNADFTYSLSGISGNFFEVDENTGEIRAKKSFDRETIDHYLFFVVATDEGDPALSSSAAISIEIGDENDNAPVFTVKNYLLILSDNTKIGTVLETIKADDPDITGSLKYDLKFDSDPIPTFINIDPIDGQLQVTKPIPPDHEQLYEFKVTCNDLIATAETNVVLQVVTVSVLEFSWVENMANLTQNIYEFLASDYFISESAVYEITAGNEYDIFEMVGNGILTNKVLLDRENISLHNIQVTVDDNSTSETFVVYVQITVLDTNDNSPEFDLDFYQFNITEGVYSQDTVIGNVRATDIDEENTGNALIHYEIVKNSSGLLKVKIDAITGDISVNGNADHEYGNDRYELIIRAIDSGQPTPLFNYVDVQIVVSDINDNTPRFDIIDVNQFILYFENTGQTNSTPYKIIARTSVAQTEVAAIEFNDPDSSDTPMATIDSIYLSLDTPYSPLLIFTNTNVTHRMNQSMFTIQISDGSYIVDVVGVIIVTEPVVTPSSSTVTPTSTGRSRSTADSALPTLTVSPTGRGVEAFASSALGIAVFTVAGVLLFAILFFLLGLMCYCYQRYRHRQVQAKQRPTSVFKRIPGERQEHTEMSYQNYDNIDSLDYPHLSPNDRQNGQLYGEHNVVETEFTDQTYPPYPYPPMYADPSHYPYPYAVPAPVYDDVTMSSQLPSDMYEEYDEEEEEDEVKANLEIKKEPGPILNQILDQFYLGDEILKSGDRKKKHSVKKSSKATV